MVVLQKALGIGIAEALPGDPVPDGTLVTLTPTGGGAVLQTQTTAGGAFTFTNVLPGDVHDHRPGTHRRQRSS